MGRCKYIHELILTAARVHNTYIYVKTLFIYNTKNEKECLQTRA